MAAKKGSLSISSENIFPIIKKWVYSDHDIFARELVSNGCDAITKLKKLDMMGEYQLPDDYKPAIKVEVNPEEKTLKFTDNGLGMTADEVEEYITQIAFSGATQFLEKYKDKTTEDDMIITSSQKVMPLDAVVVSGHIVCGYASNPKTDEAALARHIKDILKDNHYDKMTVKIFHDYTAFLSRAEGMNNMAAVEQKESLRREKKIRKIILNISM